MAAPTLTCRLALFGALAPAAACGPAEVGSPTTAAAAPERARRADVGFLADLGPMADGARPVPEGPPRFVDVALEAGLAVPHSEAEDPCVFDWDPSTCHIPHFVGGVAVGDVDQDGWPDVYLTHLDRPGTLHRNRGDGTFEDVTADLALDRAVDGPSSGAAFVDVDRDGDLDLYVTSVAPPEVRERHYLLIQQDDGTFVDETEERGAGIVSSLFHGGTSVAVGDHDRDGFPDLHVNEWLAEHYRAEPHTRLLTNLGEECPGCFNDDTGKAGVRTEGEPCLRGDAPCRVTALSSAFVDFDEDGWQDLLVVRDYGGSLFFWSRGDGTFEEATASARVGTEEFGMGSTVGDIDGDGDLDWFVSSIGDTGELCGDVPCESGVTGNRLYRYDGERRFTDITDEGGVRHGGWGWGTAFVDHDNDGDLDLVLANGMANARFPEREYARDRMFFWDNDGTGRFTECAEEVGLVDRSVGTGLAVLDYDRDGDQDLLMVRNHGVPALFRNDGGSRSAWLRVRLRSTDSAPEGQGAVVRVRVTDGEPWRVRLVDTVTHYLGQSDRVAHVGLGEGVERVAELEVRWPSGRVTRLEDVAANQRLVLDEAEAAAP
ncbi:MAG: CRTAC1 family protein [Sandaracinaceae bacterium]